MTTKQLIIGCLCVGFVIGFLLMTMAFIGCESDKWYNKVMSDPRTRAIMVDYAEEQSVTIATFKGDKLQRIEKEP